MLNSHIILPMFAMFLLTVFTLVKTFTTRIRLVKEGKLDARYFRTYQNGKDGVYEAEESRVLSRHFSNLFEAPVLFYAVCLAALATQNAGALFQLVAWLYVLARITHSFIHMGSNKIWHRIYAYMTSWIILTGLWLILVFAVLN